MRPTPTLLLLDLPALARLGAATPPCPACAPLVGGGWDSLPPGFDADAALQPAGTLVAPGDDEPTLAEHHPAGTHGWSAEAPIAPHWFPYNRCTVWACRGCTRAFLRYTEYGGYYEDARIRPLDAALLDDTPAPAA